MRILPVIKKNSHHLTEQCVQFLGAPSSLCSLAKTLGSLELQDWRGGAGLGPPGGSTANVHRVRELDTFTLAGGAATTNINTLWGQAQTKEQELTSAFRTSLRRLNNQTQAAVENTVTMREKDITHLSALRR